MRTLNDPWLNGFCYCELHSRVRQSFDTCCCHGKLKLHCRGGRVSQRLRFHWLAGWEDKLVGTKKRSDQGFWLGIESGPGWFCVWIMDTRSPCSHLLLLISCSPMRALHCPPTTFAKQTHESLPHKQSDAHAQTHPSNECRACIHDNGRSFFFSI